MKWKDFKEYVEANGVKDDTDLAYEDMNFGGNARDFNQHCVTIDVENNELRVSSEWFPDLD